MGGGSYSAKVNEDDADKGGGGCLPPASASASAAGGPGPNVPATAQLTIFYSGTVSVFDAIPAEKAQSIMFMAAAAAKASVVNNTNNTKHGVTSTPVSPVLTRSPSLQSTVSVEMFPLSPLQSVPNTSLCKLQAELPIARRHSLQRFLEKRRDRLVSKGPYPPTKKAETGEGYCPKSNAEKAGLLC